jgi:hypothetical protein
MRVRLSMLLTIFQLICMSFSGQTEKTKPDTIFFFNDLVFSTNEEKTYFENIRNLSYKDFFNLALNAKSGSIEKPKDYYNNLFNNLIRKIENNSSSTLKPEKQLKFIYRAVQNDLLKKYELYSTFDELYTNGNFNCVTATMLYGIILKYFNIDYDIKETSVHVFLVAMPETKSILLESTNPLQGYVEYNKYFKSKFVEYLKSTKIVIDAEVQTLGVDSIFDKYFFSTRTISLQNLAGLLYYNNGVWSMDNLDYKKALDHLLKSYYLYPSKKSEYLIFNSLVYLMEKVSYQDSTDWKNFLLITRFTGKIYYVDNVKYEFSRLTSKILVEKSNFELYNRAYTYILNRISDTAVRKAIAYVYHFEAGRYFYSRNNWDEAYNHFKEAYRQNPDNYEAQNLLFSSFMSSIPQKASDSEGLKEVEEFYYTYDRLQNNPDLVRLLLGIYLYMAGDSYTLGFWNKGDSYLNKYEALQDKFPSVTLQNVYLIGDVYKKPAAYYFKRNNNKKAREYILRGIKYSPNDYSLKNSLEIMK